MNIWWSEHAPLRPHQNQSCLSSATCCSTVGPLGCTMARTVPLCGVQQETMAHFIMKCANHKVAWHPHISKMVDVMNGLQLPCSDTEDKWVRFILDPSHCIPEATLVQILEILDSITKDLRFRLHNIRSINLGYRSRFKNFGQKNLQGPPPC